MYFYLTNIVHCKEQIVGIVCIVIVLHKQRPYLNVQLPISTKNHILQLLCIFFLFNSQNSLICWGSGLNSWTSRHHRHNYYTIINRCESHLFDRIAMFRLVLRMTVIIHSCSMSAFQTRYFSPQVFVGLCERRKDLHCDVVQLWFGLMQIRTLKIQLVVFGYTMKFSSREVFSYCLSITTFEFIYQFHCTTLM